MLIAGCASAQSGPARWELGGQLKPAANVDVFVHDFEGSAGLVISGARETYIVGWPTYVVTDEVDINLAAGIIWTHADSVQTLPKPPGLRRMVRPEGVSDGRGGLHLVWGDSPDSLATRPTELRYAHFDGRRWSQPEKLDDVNRGLWGFGTSLVRLASADVLFLTQTGFGDRQLVLFRLRGSKWTKTIVPTGRIAGPTYLRMAEVAPQTLVLAGVSADSRPGESDENSVFTSRSTDGGESWSPLQRSYESRGRAAHHVRMTIQPESGPNPPAVSPVYVAWHTPMVRDDSLFVRRSVDAGASWQMLPSLSLPPSARGVEVAAACDGSLHAAAHALPTDTSKLGVLASAQWAPHANHPLGRWTNVELTELSLARSPNFALRGSRAPVLVIGTARPRVKTSGDLMAITAYAVREPPLPDC